MSLIPSKFFRLSSSNVDDSAVLNAFNNSQAIIEFELDGTIISANDNFCSTVGYSLGEIRGQHHRMFLSKEDAACNEYQSFWKNLAQGNFESGKFRRIAKDGSDIWIQASYNPIFNAKGRPYKVVKIAFDITDQRRTAIDAEGKINAISRSQAVIEFNLDGTIITANENFLSTVGYDLSEVQDHHHSMFVDPKYAASAEYQEFWQQLANGEFHSGEYMRLGKGGKTVWIKATYNPVYDHTGKPYKVVKFASDCSDKIAFEKVSEVLNSYSAGDLSARVDLSDTNLYSELAENINQFGDKLSGLVTSITESASTVKLGAESIAQGNANLSKRTEQQAASLEQTASSMDEITTTVQQTAENASQANDLVKSAETQAVKGGAVIQETVEAMSEIQSSSSRIAEIISVIDEIAFQTNLLALNASVEAARAGEQGRGFAVVASEVRNLAGRSATAAKEIKDLIEDSVKKVEHGSNLVNRSGETLKGIVGGVKGVAKVVGEISIAADEQSQGIGEAHKAVAQLQMLTQQNTAMVEEATAASEELGDQARTLDRSMAFFKTDAKGARAQQDYSTVIERRTVDSPWSNSTKNDEVLIAQNQRAASGDWAEF